MRERSDVSSGSEAVDVVISEMTDSRSIGGAEDDDEGGGADDDGWA